MPKPSVTTNVVDRTTRVNSVGTYNAAIVIAAKKGPINVPTLVTSQTDFLRRYTPNETIELGWDGAHHEAFQYLATQSNLYVVRAAHTSDLADTDEDSIALFGGCNVMLYKSDLDSAPLEEGFADIDQYAGDNFDYDNVACIIYGTSEGAYNNDLAISIVTDPEQVKLDGCFLIRVYKKDRNTNSYVKMEEWTCSLDPTMKNGYGVNCFVETALEGSNYIRALANDMEDAIMDSSFTLDLDGFVKFTNKIIANTKVREANKSYAAGDVIVCTELSTATAYYTCTTAGRSAASAPDFSEAGRYLDTVIDNKCTWTLTEVVKPYATETAYEPRDIVKVTDGTTTYAYRVLGEGGTTGDTEPEWGAVTVTDGQIIWANQDQTIDILNATAYHNKPGIKGQTLDLTQYKVYKDLYLTTVYKFKETISLQDPTQMVQDAYGNWQYQVVDMAPTYTATYTGEESKEHIVLPKECTLLKLNGGSDGSEPTTGDRITALNTMKNRKKFKVALVMDGGYTVPAYHMAIDTFCTARSQDCHGLCSIPISNQIVNDNGASVIEYRTETLNANTTNLEMYVPHQLIYDQFNDKNIYISPSCFAAARIMDVAATLGWHWIAAGFNRGIVNSLDVFKDYDDTVVGSFSDNQINTICKEQGSGNVIMDDLTMMAKACDMQDAHISRFINIELRPALEEALKNFLFEFNDAETRNTIVKMLENFMRPKVANRAVQAFRIVCDETNNLPNDIQNSICNVWVYVIPTKGIRWIRCSVILTPQGAQMGEFEEQ